MSESMEGIRSRESGRAVEHSSLGRTIKIGSRAHVSVIDAPSYRQWGVRVVEVMIGIGKDHVGYLTMDEDAWKAFKAGEGLEIDSVAQFKKKVQ